MFVGWSLAGGEKTLVQRILRRDPGRDDRQKDQQRTQRHASRRDLVAGDIGPDGDRLAHRKVIRGSIAAHSRSVSKFTTTTKNANTTRPACTIV